MAGARSQLKNIFDTGQVVPTLFALAVDATLQD